MKKEKPKKIKLTEEWGFHEIKTTIHDERRICSYRPWKMVVEIQIGNGPVLFLAGPNRETEEEARTVATLLNGRAKTILDRVEVPSPVGLNDKFPGKFNPKLPQWLGTDDKRVVHALMDGHENRAWCDGSGEHVNIVKTSDGNLTTTLGDITCPVCKLHFGI